MDQPQIVAQLGSGGMADVFLAMRRGIGGFVKLVVIKRLRTGAVDGDEVAMFHDEARISARLNHPNVVQTREVGFDGENYRLEMEYLDGQPLHRIVSRARRAGRSIDPNVAVAVVRDVLAGLGYAHDLRDYDGSPLGIVHRDVSPQNIFITYDGSVKLVDFGIAKVAGQLAVTQLGMVKGKIRYMAPEQATGRPVDRRTDVFAAGVVLYQLLVGRSYWSDADDLAVLHALSRGDLPPGPRSINPEISEVLDAVCQRALAAEPDDRYATAEDFIEALTASVPVGVGARSLGGLAFELFPDVRESIRLEIEKAAARPHSEGDDEPNTKIITMAQSSSSNLLLRSDLIVTQLERVEKVEKVDGSERPVSQAVPVQELPPRMSRLALASSVLICLLALVLVVLSVRPLLEAPPQPSASGAAATSAPAPESTIVVLPTLVQPPAPASAQPAEVEQKQTGRQGGKGRGRGGSAQDRKPLVDAGASVVAPVSTKPALLGGDMWDSGNH